MGVGKKWPCEAKTFRDPATGIEVIKLTNFRCNSNHLYFTNNCWYDDNTKIVFCSDRDNRNNLFSMDMKTYEITQITDLPDLPLPLAHTLGTSIVDPVRNVAYLGCGRDVMSVDLKTLETKVLYTMPEKYIRMMVSCSADSDYVYTSILEDLSDEFPVDLHHDYVGFREIFQRHPDSRIAKIRVDGSGYEYVWTENNWIGHVNVSPTNQDLITFCHEGPWDLVDNRIWGMDTTTGKVWIIRPRKEDESVGHEYWYADGVHVGYHGMMREGKKLMGVIRYDNTEMEEVDFNFQTGHIHSRDRGMIVGDGTAAGKYIRLWQYNGSGYDAPKALCQHLSTFKTQEDHAHPCFSPDGKWVLFSSDHSGYTSVYFAKIPDDLSTLPNLSDLMPE